jgi:hypothetical protein
MSVTVVVQSVPEKVVVVFCVGSKGSFSAMQINGLVAGGCVSEHMGVTPRELRTLREVGGER